MRLLLCGPHAAAQPGAVPAVRSAGASPQGVILVYDIANRWSFDGIHRWIKEIDEVCLGAQRSLPVGSRVSGWGRACGPGHQASAPGRMCHLPAQEPPDARTGKLRSPGPARGLVGSRAVTGVLPAGTLTSPLPLGTWSGGDHTHC